MPPQTISGPNGSWYLSEFRLNSNEPAHVPETAMFTLSLDKEGRASGQVACNSWRGGYSVAAGQLLLQDLSSTRMRCLIPDEATAELEPVYLVRLESGGDFQVYGDSLELKFADGLHWRFQRR